MTRLPMTLAEAIEILDRLIARLTEHQR